MRAYGGEQFGIPGNILGALMTICTIATGMGATIVRPWGWYALLASSWLGLVAALLYGVFIAPDRGARIHAAVAVSIYFSLVFSYFYRRRAMFGARWRWAQLERWVPWIAGPEVHAGPPRGFRDLSLGKRAILVIAVIGLLLGDLGAFHADRPSVPEIPLASFSAATDAAPFVSLKQWAEEVLVTDGTSSLYFNNTPRSCYAFEVPGTHWIWGSEQGLLRSGMNFDLIGVLLLSERDVKGLAGASLTERGAAAIRRAYESSLGKRISVELIPIQAPRFGATKWSASWTHDDASKTVGKAEKVFLDLGSGWIAQITAMATREDRGVPIETNSVFRRVSETLGTTAQRECYWPYLRQRYPKLFPAQGRPV